MRTFRRRPKRTIAIAATTAAVLALGSTAAASATPEHGPKGGSAEATAASVRNALEQAVPRGHVKPTIVLVHGAWADASGWSTEVSVLQAAGYTVHALPNPVEDLYNDSAIVSNYLKTIKGPVVLVGHSYGGAVITNAAASAPNVKALVYVDAVEPDVGEGNISLVGDASAVNSKIPGTQLYDTISYPGAGPDDTESFLKENIFVQDFASDLPRAQAEQLYAEQRGADTPAFTEPTKQAAWKTIPSWAFISTGDKIITAQAKISMAQRAHSKTTIYPGGSHLSLISHPYAVTATIGDAIRAVS